MQRGSRNDLLAVKHKAGDRDLGTAVAIMLAVVFVPMRLAVVVVAMAWLEELEGSTALDNSEIDLIPRRRSTA